MSVTPIFSLDSVTHLQTQHRGAVVSCASHGGAYAGYYAATKGVAAAILNDAGIGREQAGIAGLTLLEGLNVPAATVLCTTARIGDGDHSAAHGRLSFINRQAQALGLVEGMPCQDALARLSDIALPPAPTPRMMQEARFEIATFNGRRVTGMDSIALVTDTDVGQIIISGSHGGLLGNRPQTAIKVAAMAAVYNDAGGGLDAAGLSRLPALDGRAIAAACVSCFSARIGDARSTWEHGFISALNETARKRGGRIGQSCRAFAEAMAAGEW